MSVISENERSVVLATERSRGARPSRLTAKTEVEWWARYFDAHYLSEYEPVFTLERDRQEVARLIDILGLPAGARILVICGGCRASGRPASIRF